MPNPQEVIKELKAEALKRFNGKGYANEVVKFLSESNLKVLEAVREEVSWIKKRANKKGNYNGNELRTAEDYYGISASSWVEIIRYEEGINKVLTEIDSNLTQTIEELKK